MISVLSSFPRPRPTTNPYIVQLAGALQEISEIELSTFSWRRALTRRFDVFHAHWPEILVGGRPGPKKALRQVLFVLLMVRFRAQRTAIVRTVHNLHLPEGLSLAERALLTWFDRCTDHRIVINPTTKVPADQPHSVILHGHYRDWFGHFPRDRSVPGRLAFIGLIRRYKGTEGLVEAFHGLPDPKLSLTVSGKPSSGALAQQLRSIAEDDPRIQFRFDFLPDEELVATTTQAELVVLPYRHMHNSGGVLTALSLGRPVLVPDNEANRELADEVGPGWVHVFHGDIDAADLQRALTDVRSSGVLVGGAQPRLEAREWTNTASLHLQAYRAALCTVRGRNAIPHEHSTTSEHAP